MVALLTTESGMSAIKFSQFSFLLRHYILSKEHLQRQTFKFKKSLKIETAYIHQATDCQVPYLYPFPIRMKVLSKYICHFSTVADQTCH